MYRKFVSMNTLNISFVLRKNACKGQPVPYTRVTINSMQAIFKSLKTIVPENQWDDGKSRVKGHSELVVQTNDKIKAMICRVEEAFEELNVDIHFITGDELREKAYPSPKKGKSIAPENTLLARFNKFIEYKRKQEVMDSSLNVYKQVYRKMVKLLEKHYKVDDIPVENIDPYFMINFAENFPCAKGTMKTRIGKFVAFFIWLSEQPKRFRHSQDPNKFHFTNDVIVPDYNELVYERLNARPQAKHHTIEEYEAILAYYQETQNDVLGLLFQIETCSTSGKYSP